MIECHGSFDFDIFPFAVEIKPATVLADVEVSACRAMLVQLDLACTSHVHVVHEFLRRKDMLKGRPVWLPDCD
jgi:hypothetical protein